MGDHLRSLFSGQCLRYMERARFCEGERPFFNFIVLFWWAVVSGKQKSHVVEGVQEQLS